MRRNAASAWPRRTGSSARQERNAVRARCDLRVLRIEFQRDVGEELTTHPSFSLANPNRVRALIGGFAQNNQTQFNRTDGAGFEFLAGSVLALDPKNPQVAARLTTAFRSWRALEPVRRGRAEAALRRVAAAPNLSRDLRISSTARSTPADPARRPSSKNADGIGGCGA